MSATYFAPAKLNLFLHVTGRRDDGYHLLESVFQLIDFGDTLTIDSRDDGVIRRINQVAGVPAEDDLAVRAAQLLQHHSGTLQGADLTLEKQIPLGGGLGGGSSDAATVLLALNRLWQLDYSRQQLMALALTLGADVPFFVFGQNAFAQGVGECLAPVQLPPLWYVVVQPQVRVPTAAIFASPELTRNAKSVKIADFSAGGQNLFAGPLFRNDLQPVAKAKYPAVGQAIEWLGGACGQHAVADLAAASPATAAVVISPRMTGSGACVFAGFGSEAAAQTVFAQRPAGVGGFVARGLSRHPLHDFAGEQL